MKSQETPWWRQLNLLKRKRPLPPPEQRNICPEHGSSFFSLLTWQWISPLIAVGYQRPIEANDIWLVNPDRRVEKLRSILDTSFKKRLKARGRWPLLGALYDMQKRDFILGGFCQLMASILQVLTPYCLRYLVAFSQNAFDAKQRGEKPPSIGVGIGWVIGILVMQTLQSQCINRFLYCGMTTGGQSRAVLISVIFDKTLKISGRGKAGHSTTAAPPCDVQSGSTEEKRWFRRLLKRQRDGKGRNLPTSEGQAWSNGRIVNLMSTDTWRIDQACGMLHTSWTAPIEVAIAISLLIINISYSALAGFALFVIAVPILAKAVRSLLKRRTSINKITDRRIRLTQEILQAVHSIKYFGWETNFLQRLDDLRSQEIRSIQKILVVRNAITAMSMCLPVFASLVAFAVYSLTRPVLDPALVFSSLALFNGLRMPLNFLPTVGSQIIDAYSSIQRIQEFLMVEEAEDDTEWDLEMGHAVVVQHGSFTWEITNTGEEDAELARRPPGEKPEQDKDKTQTNMATSSHDAEKAEAVTMNTMSVPRAPFELHDLSMTIGRGELIAVIGAVGSGKTSLLAALAGEMRCTGGRLILGASRRAFCPQYAWVQNATARQNIIFGSPFDRARYESIVDACALRPDFELLPDGDMTEVGERGITLSGGQKQRLNIARAIYFNADIVMLDDPLSAVDANVGRHIMDNAICGLLKDKCRILATHQLHVLSKCDRIVLMRDGHMSTIDTFENLRASNEEFMELMKTTVAEEHDKEDVPIEKVAEDDVQVMEKHASKQQGGREAAVLMQVEDRAVKAIDWAVWAAYFKCTGSWLIPVAILVMLCLSQGSNIVTSLWLSWWTANSFGYSKGEYIGVYFALGATQAVTTFLFSFWVSYSGTQASKVMSHRAIHAVLKAPMSFFDTTPMGRIINRFSKDTDVMDNNLPDSFRQALLIQAMMVAIFILIIAYYYYFAVALVPLFIIFLFAAGYYRSSARDIKRHEAVLRSHVFSKFSEAVLGVSTIRAYGLQEQFSRTVTAAIDEMNSAYFLTFANQRWLSIRLDAIGIALVLATGILVVTSRFSTGAHTSGLVLSYILSVVGMVQFTVRQFADVENNMNATERIQYYGNQLDQEASAASEVRPTWPERGNIVFEHVSVRYRDGLPLVLRGLSMDLAAGERIGIVGRTGAGKSSIMTALFRLVELSAGKIFIDGVDISTIGLHDLRSRLAIIPQDPTLFRGTVRYNLDPFNQHTDLELWSALRQSGLVEGSIDNTFKRLQLETVVEEEGLNFSLGQRQLMALARALARGSQIIVCDEATSSIDFETDRKIQRAILEGFKGKTLLCIAHRLNTVIGYDRICVMDKGQIAELDTPLALFDKAHGGIFRSMCEKSGITREHIVQETHTSGNPTSSCS